MTYRKTVSLVAATAAALALLLAAIWLASLRAQSTAGWFLLARWLEGRGVEVEAVTPGPLALTALALVPAALAISLLYVLWKISRTPAPNR